MSWPLKRREWGWKGHEGGHEDMLGRRVMLDDTETITESSRKQLSVVERKLVHTHE